VSRKKTNPRRRPATQADVDKAFADGISAGVNTAMAILFIVLLDKTEADEDFIAELMPPPLNLEPIRMSIVRFAICGLLL
jgi:hypothetical protein